jgi:hypothetical protein
MRNIGNDRAAQVAPALDTVKLTTARRAAIAAALAIAIGLAAPAASALPVNATCRITTYYADASMTTVVGTYSTCPGSRGLSGRRTRFFEIDEVQIGTGPRPKPPGNSPFPCDLQEHCVTHLPTPTVVEPWPPKKK